MSEIWVCLPKPWHFYEVSDQGRVRSLDRYLPHWRGGLRRVRGIVLRPQLVKNYLHVTLKHEGNVYQVPLHRLVATVFVPNPEEKPHVNHIDGIKTHDAAVNLGWMTPSENNYHAFSIGLKSNVGELNSQSVLRERDVVTIRKRLERGETCVAVAADYPVTDRLISQIKRRVIWNHI